MKPKKSGCRVGIRFLESLDLRLGFDGGADFFFHLL